MSSSRSDGSSKKSNDASFVSDACVVCFKTFDIFSIGSCDHPVCYECSTRMRVLCKQMECPICRQDLVKVAFVKCVKPFHQLSFNNYLMDKSAKIYFENQSIQEAFTKLLIHSCQVCSNNPIFPNLQTLKDHLRKEHEHFFCELCVEHLKIFTSERRAYSRSELALHRRKGDADNTSHRGHPLCNFCDKRYVDGDELFRHLRRDHYFCHFCDADGLNQFYCAYEDLREHFREAHFLCEIDECIHEKFTRVFRTDIDFRAHRAQVHSQSMGKAAARQARTLELEFTLAPRPTSDNKGRSNQRRVGSRIQTKEEPSTSTATDLETQRTVSSVSVAAQHTTDLRNPEDFPRLGQVQQTHDHGSVSTQTRSSTSDSLAQKIAKGSRFTVRNGNGSQNDEFPSLMSIETSSATQPTSEASKTDEKAYSKGTGDGAKRPLNLRVGNKEEKKQNGNSRVDSNQNVSIQLMQTYPPIVAQGVGPPSQPIARVTRVSTSQNIHVQPNRGLHLDSDFPSLIPAAPPLQEPSNSKASWVKKDPPKLIKSTAPKGSLQTKDKPSRSPALEDYPALSRSASKSQVEVPRLNSVKVKAAVVNGNKNILPVKSTATASLPGVESWSESSKSRGKKKKNHQLKSGYNSDPDEMITFTSTAERKVSEMQLGELKSLSTLMGGTRLDLAGVANATESKSVGSKIGLIKQPLENKSMENGGAKPKTKTKPIPLNQSDFPALGQSSSTPTPIFFEKKKETVSRPPEPTKVTFMSSSGQNFPLSIDDSLTRKFLQPPDFAVRNQQLISTVMDLLCHQKSKIDKFRSVSTEFRSDQLKAEGYYRNCLEIMGDDCFLALFPELVCLLPDIDKQQQLLKVHRSQMRTKGPLGAEPYVVCATCNQILAPSDLKHHIASHSLETNFPCLGTTDGSSAWSKR